MRSLYSFLFVLSLFCVQAQKISITQLEVEKLTRPLGLDNQNPDFSWIIKSDEHNLSQTHARLSQIVPLCL